VVAVVVVKVVDVDGTVLVPRVLLQVRVDTVVKELVEIVTVTG